MKFLGTFKVGNTIRYSVNFHDNANTTADPGSPAARHRKPDNTYANLAAPAKLDAKTGWYGGSIDTTGYAVGSHEVRISGTVDAREVATVISFELESYDVDNIYSELLKVKKETGIVYYVNAATGNDGNNGLTPGTAKLTIGAAKALAVAGDTVVIGAGTYDHVDLDTTGVTYIFGAGVIISDSNSVFEVSGDYNVLKFQTALIYSLGSPSLTMVVSGDRNKIWGAVRSTAQITLSGHRNQIDGFVLHTDCVVSGHFNLLNNISVHSFALGFQITGDCNLFKNCGTYNCIKSFEASAASAFNIFKNCFQSESDGAKTDAGTNNTWVDFRVGSKILAGNPSEQDSKDIHDKIPSASIADYKADVSALATQINMDAGFAALNDPTVAVIADAIWDELLAGHQGLTTFGGAIRVMLALQKQNIVWDNTAFDAQGNVTSMRVRLFDTSVAALAATDGGSGEGEFLALSVTGAYTGGKLDIGKAVEA